MTYAITPEDFDTLVALAAAQSPPVDPVGAAILLYIESAGFDPSNPGPPAAKPPVGGLNQMQTPNLTSLGLTRDAWLAMTAAQQLPWIFTFWQGLTKTFAGGVFPADGPRLTALNMLPAAYQAVSAGMNPAGVLCGKAGPYASAYAGNAYYDPDATGTVSVTTIARRLALVDASAPARWLQIKAGIAAAQARRAAAAAGAVAVVGSPALTPSGGSGPPSGATRGVGGGGGFIAFAVVLGAVWMRAKGGKL